MTDMRPHYLIRPGDLLDVELVQADGTRALVRGRIDGVPQTCTGHQALVVRLAVTFIRAVCPPTEEALPPLRLVSSD